MELIVHEWNDKRRKLNLVQIMSSKGEVLAGPYKAQADELLELLKPVCEKNGGRVMHDANTIGKFFYVNGPNVDVYKDALEQILDRFAEFIDSEK